MAGVGHPDGPEGYIRQHAREHPWYELFTTLIALIGFPIIFYGIPFISIVGFVSWVISKLVEVYF